MGWTRSGVERGRTIELPHPFCDVRLSSRMGAMVVDCRPKDGVENVRDPDDPAIEFPPPDSEFLSAFVRESIELDREEARL